MHMKAPCTLFKWIMDRHRGTFRLCLQPLRHIEKVKTISYGLLLTHKVGDFGALAVPRLSYKWIVTHRIGFHVTFCGSERICC